MILDLGSNPKKSAITKEHGILFSKHKLLQKWNTFDTHLSNNLYNCAVWSPPSLMNIYRIAGKHQIATPRICLSFFNVKLRVSSHVRFETQKKRVSQNLWNVLVKSNEEISILCIRMEFFRQNTGWKNISQNKIVN